MAAGRDSGLASYSPPRARGAPVWKAGAAIVAVAMLALVVAALPPLLCAEGPPRLSPYVATDHDPGAGDASILVLISPAARNPYGPYLAEILHAEGINEVRAVAWPALRSLAGFDAILLAEGPVDETQAEALRAHVAGGGLLIGMRPEARLASLFGVERQPGTSTDGLLRVRSGAPLAGGIDSGPLRYHGEADHYRAAGADVVAWLADDAGVAREQAAVTVRRWRTGVAVLFAYDLARSVVLTRQGNPAWAGAERDGIDGIRVGDLFAGWTDVERMAVPHADEQQRLLVNLVSAARAAAPPRPRWWYFPRGAAAVLVATADSHASPAYAIEDVLSRVERRGGHASVYYDPPRSGFLRRTARRLRWWAARLPWIGARIANPTGFPSPAQVASWRARGNEFGLHPWAEDGPDLASDWRVFTGLGYGPVPPTVRTHRVLWSGWVETARAQAAAGVHMNLDAYQVGPAFRTAAGEWALGFFNGSGLPMHFVDEQGRILDIYQQATELADEHWIAVAWGGQAKLRGTKAVGVSRRLLESAVERAPAAIGAQFHVDSFVHPGSHRDEAALWLDGTLDAAAVLRVPIVSAGDWLGFNQIRRAARLRDLVWDAAADRLSFRVATAPGADVGLTLLLPLEHRGARLAAAEMDGARIELAERRLGAIHYGGFAVSPGRHAVSVRYERP